jgi:catechol-2,3-dioxygenase
MTKPAFSHIGIYVQSLERMTDFYQYLLQLTITDTGKLDTPNGPVDLVFLSSDPTEHHQLVLASGRPEAVAFNVINQMSFRVGGLDDLRQLHQAMTTHGASDIQPVTHGNAVSIYFRDPEGNRLEVFYDTPWYVDQPMRLPIDLSLPNDALEAQIHQHASTLPGFCPRQTWIARMQQRMDHMPS